MLSIDGSFENLIETKKSKFIAFCYYVASEQDVNKFIGLLHKDYADSTHICYAYVLSTPNKEKACDDGEPDGTAGKQILDVIKKKGLSNVLVAVVRYFGGIKLGAGGLARTYRESAVEVINKSKIVQYDMAYYYTEHIAMADVKKRLSSIQSSGAVVSSIQYGVDVVVQYYAFAKLNDDYIKCELTKKD